MFEGSTASKILFISDYLRISDAAENQILAGERRDLLFNSCKRAGIFSEDISMVVIHPAVPTGGNDISRIPLEQRRIDREACKQIILQSKANVIVPLGTYALEFLTGLESIDKWHLSIVQTTAEFGNRKVVPLLHPAEVISSRYSDMAYISFGCLRLKEEMQSPKTNIPERKFHTNLNHQDTMKYLRKCLSAKILSFDIETGNSIINTVGFAFSETEAIAIEVLPYNKDPKQYMELWQMIRAVLESSIPKVCQNYIHETQFLSKYGIYINNIHHDTMWAMKFLHPEFEKGLDNVGRIYTRFPYWKEDGKDWNNINNWHEHLTYNCKDTTGTLAAYYGQRKALESRNLSAFFYGFVMQYVEPIREMCTRGLLVNEQTLERLKFQARGEADNFMRIIDAICLERIGRTVNPRSPKQLKDALKEMGIKLPTKYNRKTKRHDETADKKSLVKLRKRYKDEEIIPALIGLSSKNKQLSSYLEFGYDRGTQPRVRYTLDGCATETGRWAGYTDAWGNGFNPQTVPKSMRDIFHAEPGKILVQIDLSQAESRYVAYESPEPRLIKMLEDREDVHRFVAGAIYNKPPEIIGKNSPERQLGKKSGHSANYGVGPDTFAEACLTEMDLVITRGEAKRIIDTYFMVFPGIKNRQTNIQRQIRTTKKLTTPLGRERVFYDRIGDGLFREAYAYAPQSTIPDITNCLMLYLYPHCEMLLQVHDSILVQVDKDKVHELASTARQYEKWHPKINLPGGELLIPIDIEAGTTWKKMEKI